MNLELMAMRWLRFEKRCPIVLRERTPRWVCGTPDVLGVTASRYAIEIEIKRSLSDFRADRMKPRTRRREFYVSDFPKQFYYLVLPALLEQCQSELPEWAGLMSADEYFRVAVAVSAPVNRESKRYSTRHCVALAHLMANQVIAAEQRLNDHLSNFRYGYEPWLNPDAPHYQI